VSGSADKEKNGPAVSSGTHGYGPALLTEHGTVGMIIGLLATGHSKEEVLKLYPYLEPEDVEEALAYAAWRVEEMEAPVIPANL